jgi:hypothetical protein
MENPQIGESLSVRFRGDWLKATVRDVDGRDFTVVTVAGDVIKLKDTSHLSVQQKGWDLDRTAANRIANH